MDRRTARRQARLEAMLDVAMAIASDEGLDALTIARLCDALHLSVGGLYRYFPSKEAIHVALQDRTIRRFDSIWRQVVADSESHLGTPGRQDAVAALYRILIGFSTYLDHAWRVPVEHRLLDSFLSVPEKLLSDEQAIATNLLIQAIVDGFSDLFAKATVAGALAPGDAGVRTHVLWATLHGLDHFRKRDRILPIELRVDALTEAAFRAMFTGWGAPAKALDEALALWTKTRPRPETAAVPAKAGSRG